MIKTIAKVGYAMITSADEADYTYDTPTYFKSSEAGGRSVSAEPEGETTKIYADGLAVIEAEENAGYKISLELISIIDDIETKWLGNKKAEDGSIIEMNSGEEKPRFALVVAKEQFKGEKKYQIDIYLDCSVSKRPTRSDKTSEGKFDPNFPTYEISAVPRETDKYVRLTMYADELPQSIVVPDLTSEASVNQQTQTEQTEPTEP